MDMFFSKWLADARKGKGLTQVELAEKLGLANGTISHLETGHNQPSLATLRKIAAFFKIRIDKLSAMVKTEREL
jgi:transcriptional regulator with XRE-family HTH domain